ncbi:endonuclease domain-containing protein [Maribellus sediminis]|uniref:endonuclease domain-containing protein n=1 Tax=Maribellus sediminis TaxID=2696285 RepID=UPI00143154C9|nr:endonuclease domain-containing protein [Maribellus sediminis]
MSNNYSHISRARKLRRVMTEEENMLWQKLRGRKLLGLKFLRQHPIIYDRINHEPTYFIPDFYCAEKKLIIEVDGKIHDFQKQKDLYREEILKSGDLRILRIKNEDINNNLIGTLAVIKEYILNLP